MLGEFVCVQCGKKFTREWSGHGGSRPRFCAACIAERKCASNRRQSAEINVVRKRERREAAKAAKVVRKCRRRISPDRFTPGYYLHCMPMRRVAA